MTSPIPPTQDDAFDRALSQRLASLSHMPVDTSSFDKALRAQLPSPPSVTRANNWRRVFRPLVAVAASLIVIALVALALQNQSVQAVPADAMVQMHRDIIAGKVETHPVTSIDEANSVIAAFASEFPRVSEPPQAHTMACCMRNVGDKKVACILLTTEGAKVTLAIANTDAVTPAPGTRTSTHNGIPYEVQTIGTLTMVMFERNHQHICMIGELPESKLIALTEGLKF